MHARILNAISLAAGVGVTTCLFLSVAQVLRTQERANAVPPAADDLEVATLAMPPPPPPKPEEKPAAVPQVSDAIPLGFQEEPSTSLVKIAPSPPSLDEVLPPREIPLHVIAGMIGLESSLKPKLDLSIDDSRVYQKSEVDKLPFVISRPDPAVPASVIGASGIRSVVVLFVVDQHGAVGKVRVLRSSGSAEFDSIITDSIPEWTFSPAIKKGKPVRCLIQQQVKVQMGHRDAFSL